jgi:hypothetical protein
MDVGPTRLRRKKGKALGRINPAVNWPRGRLGGVRMQAPEPPNRWRRRRGDPLVGVSGRVDLVAHDHGG